MTTLPLPPVDAVLARPRREALDALRALGWRTAARPPALDAARRRRLNLDLSDPDLLLERGGEVEAVARVETDGEGRAVLLEVVGGEPADPARTAAALLGRDPGAPRTGGDAAAREWIWGPEAGTPAAAGSEPVRIWICAERAQGDRLWLVASLVRRPGDDD